VVTHEDDLRTGAFKYTVINDAYVNNVVKNKPTSNQHTHAASSSSSSPSSSYLNMAHVRLPHPNEAVCVDTLLEFTPPPQFDLASYLCWRYPRPRALVHLKILPLPFVTTLDAGLDEPVVPGVNTNNKKQPEQFKCYLEYLNECTRKFTVLKEFCLREDTDTIVIEKQDGLLLNGTVSLSKHFVYARVWRVRLGNEAKRAVCASSLLVSTIADSIELDQQCESSNSSLLAGLGLVNVHLELAVSNIELKLNSVHLNTNDLVLVNVSDVAGRVLVNRFERFTAATLSLYAQLGVEYCEYKFLTLRPLVDPFQFKVNAKCNLDEVSAATLLVDLDVDTVNLLLSQSGLVALKQLESEWKVDPAKVSIFLI
jgi:hypothetical protein